MNDIPNRRNSASAVHGRFLLSSGLLIQLCAAEAISVSICLVLVGCRTGTALTPQQANGKHLYDVRCAHCHEENDLSLKVPPPSIDGVFGRSSLPSGAPATDAEVQKVVLQGKGMMPAFAGRFTPEQMSDLLAYLHKDTR